FFIGSVAETNRAPFDLSEADINSITGCYYTTIFVFISITRYIIIDFIVKIIMNKLRLYNLSAPVTVKNFIAFDELHCAKGKVNRQTFIRRHYSSLSQRLHPQ